MNAVENDADFVLEKNSSDLIADVDRALVIHLCKQDGSGALRVRSFVRARDAFAAICNVLDNFQELPQLLDPYLSKWIPFLARCYLESLVNPRRDARARLRSRSKALVPLSFAVSKILYTLCKVRGEKVVVRFLNAEAKYLEPLLSSIEEAESRAAAAVPSPADRGNDLGAPDNEGWAWEQRYIVLLWLSHLLFAPFDLATISSVELEDDAVPEIEGLPLSGNLPGITLRVLPLAIKYLASPGKERDAAKALLVRMAMRRDMQALGVLDGLVSWALMSLGPPSDAETPRPAYFYLGVLSFLAGVLTSSSETSDMNTHLSSIFHAVHALTLNDNQVSKVVNALALARKMIIKVIRSLVVTLLRKTRKDMQAMEITETAIGYLLESLSDNDTPVRMSASKSLSVITLKLDPDMASQVVEAVLESLNRNVLWNKREIEQGARPVRNLSAVNHLEWHGFILTLSHLLYRRSPPARQLSDIIHALLLGLSFEQRALSGGSVGANVRDAACFGVWALARRYTTDELLAIPLGSVFAAKTHPPDSSIIQVLATELVTAACLDPFGNIRRGSSAALQELIGRHPDTVEQGISLVQSVDYHAVARRSRAIQQVASSATTLASQYGQALLHGILGWRGVGDMDAPSRRDSGAAFGVLTTLLGSKASKLGERYGESFAMVQSRLDELETRRVEERHGLLLCLASLQDQFPEFASADDAIAMAESGVSAVGDILQNCHDTIYRRAELIAEAASQLAISTVPLLQYIIYGGTTKAGLENGSQVLSPSRPGLYLEFLGFIREAKQRNELVALLAEKLAQISSNWLDLPDADTIVPVATAALLQLILSTEDSRAKLLLEWAKLIQSGSAASRTAVVGQAYFHVLAMAQPLAEAISPNAEWDDLVSEAFLARWMADRQVETHVSLLQSLIRARALRSKPFAFLPLLVEGLNDYTTNARGDVGSQVRVQALRAVRVLWEDLSSVTGEEDWVVQSVEKLFYPTLRLSVEKLDRVRPEAQAALASVMQEREASNFGQLSTTSKAYFKSLLELLNSAELLKPVMKAAMLDPVEWMSQLMAGLVTSADTGQEDLVITSRAAVTEFCQGSKENVRLVCRALLYNLKTYRAEDRITVPTLEVIAYMFHTGLLQQDEEMNLGGLCLETQRVGYKTGNVRKILACIKVYGCVAGIGAAADVQQQQQQRGSAEARKRLGALMFHPWPRVRMAVVDEVWVLMGEEEGVEGELLGVDWGRADKDRVRAVVEKLKLGTS